MVLPISQILLGNPVSDSHQPSARELAEYLQALFLNLTGANAGALIQTNKAALDALTPAANTMAWVIGDANPDLDGVYQYAAGAWVKRGPLPYPVIQLNNADAGTANAIQVTTAVGMPSAAFGALFLLNITQANTGAVTVAINGAAAKPLISNTGSPLLAGAITAGMALLCVDDGTSIRLLVPGDIDAIIAEAEALLAAAEAIAGNAYTFNTLALAASATIPATVETIRLNGYYSAGDGGDALYKRAASEPAHGGKFQSADGAWWEIVGDTLDIRAFGAKCDGVAVDTPALLTAGSQFFAGKDIRFPSADIVCAGTIPVYSKFVGIAGMPKFKLTVNGGADVNGDRGFWMKSGGEMHNCIIERGVTAGAISGEFNNGAVVGEYYTLGTEYTDIHMSNMWFIGIDAGVGRRSIFGIYGNVHGSTFKEFRYSGFISYAMMIHWGGNFDPTAPDSSAVTQSWHPRRLLIDGVFFEGPQPDAALGCVYISGGHDIDCRRVFTNGVRTPVVVAAGDVGGLVAQGDSVGQVLKNIRFSSLSLLNYQICGLLMSGLSGDRAGGQWIAINEGASVTVDGLVIRRGALSSSARAIDIRLMTGLRIRGLEITHENDGFLDILTPAIFLQACDDTEISGKTKVPFATELVGCGKKVKIDTTDICLRTDYNTSCYATRLTGQSGAHLLGAALAIGDQTLTLQSLSFDVVAGSTITVGGRTMVLTKAAAQSATAVTLSITPSFVAAASGTSATVEKYTGDIDLDGYAEGFYIGLLCNNTSSGRARGVRSSRNFRRSGLYDIYGRAVRGLRIDGSMKECNQLDDANGDNVRLINGCSDVMLDAPSFEDNDDASTKARRNLYLFGDTVAFRAIAPAFYNAQLSAVNYFAPSVSGEMQPSFGAAYFGPMLPNRITGTGVAKGMTVGDKQRYFVTSTPAASLGANGDEAILETIVSGQPERWRKSAGAWVVLATAP